MAKHAEPGLGIRWYKRGDNIVLQQVYHVTEVDDATRKTISVETEWRDVPVVHEGKAD